MVLHSLPENLSIKKRHDILEIAVVVLISEALLCRCSIVIIERHTQLVAKGRHCWRRVEGIKTKA